MRTNFYQGNRGRDAWQNCESAANSDYLVLALCLALFALGLSVRGAASTNAPGMLELEFQNLLAVDEQAQEQVAQWQKLAAQADPTGEDSIRQAALNLKIRQRMEEVTKQYEKFLKAHPRHVKAHLAFGSFLRDAGRDAEALKQLEQARALDPNDPAVWNNLGNYYGHNGPATNAFVCYAKAIELDPKQPLYYHNLGRNIYIYHDTAEAFYQMKTQDVLAKAQELYRRALALNPTNFMIASDLAQSYYAFRLPLSGDREADQKGAQKLCDEALAAWQAALKLARNDHEREGVQLHMARIQISASRFEEARQSLARVKLETLAGTKAELEARLAKEAAKTRPLETPPNR